MLPYRVFFSSITSYTVDPSLTFGIENGKREFPALTRLGGVTKREAVEALARLAQEDKEPARELPIDNVTRKMERLLRDCSVHIRGRYQSKLTKQSLPVPTLPSYLLCSSALSPISLSFASIPVVAALTTFRSNQLLVFCFTIVVSSYSNSYELVTVVAAAANR
ncbi:hypothetical protein ACTXT7_011547 [Hymenolepis weldensis]